MPPKTFDESRGNHRLQRQEFPSPPPMAIGHLRGPTLVGIQLGIFWSRPNHRADLEMMRKLAACALNLER